MEREPWDLINSFVFESSLKDMFIDFFFRREEGGERSINWLPPICTLSGDQTLISLVYGTMLQPLSHPARATFIALTGTVGIPVFKTRIRYAVSVGPLADSRPF